MARKVACRLMPLVLLSINSGWIFAAPSLSMAVFLSQAPAQAQAMSAEDVAKVAQAITVRIEGATQGSGVLVKREGNRYTVLTAWHVVSGQKQGEELDIYTSDGQRQQAEQGSIKRLGQVDMAVLNFTSTGDYQTATIGDVKTVNRGDQVLVTGFPNESGGKINFNFGKLVANAAVGIDQGYQLLYRNTTSSGMSGGAIIKSDGSLIGMHGRGEIDTKQTTINSKIVKTGVNQGVPIDYYVKYSEGRAVLPERTVAKTRDDFDAIAQASLVSKQTKAELNDASSNAKRMGRSAEAEYYKALSLYNSGNYTEACRLFQKAQANRMLVQSGKWVNPSSRRVLDYTQYYLGNCAYMKGDLWMANFRFSNSYVTTSFPDPLHRLSGISSARLLYSQGKQWNACMTLFEIAKEYKQPSDESEYQHLCAGRIFGQTKF